MVSDSIANVSSAPSAPNSRDFGKKKRANRSAKLKQCKLDARREQWLAQVKKKGCKEEINGNGDRQCSREKRRDNQPSLPNLEISREGEENDGSIHHESDTESPSNSPTSSFLGGTDSGTNFTGSSSSSTSSGDCCSGSITDEEEDGDDGCLDDWEAVADALAADDKHENENPCSELPPEPEPIVQSVPLPESNIESGLGVRNVKPECPRIVPRVPRVPGNCKAWGADDAYRPQSLPTLAKQRSFPTSERHFCQGGVPWLRKSTISVPSSCPICYEDLDSTDSSFLPCACGFRLCLFCHKRILEEDGRCPGCRKPYEQEPIKAEAGVRGGGLTFRLARSCSMFTRS